MAMKFTKTDSNLHKHLQLNAGILLTEFNPTTNASAGDVIGATSGGVSFTATPSYSDLFDGIDNVPANTKEGKRLDSWECKMSGSFASIDKENAKRLAGAADISENKIVPRDKLKDADFEDIWWVGDYSDINEGTKAGYCAIHLINSLSTGGFAIQSNDKANSSHSFEFTGHYSLADMSKVPFEIYIAEGSAN